MNNIDIPRKPVQKIWFDHIEKRQKTYEGRVKTGDWANYCQGQYLKFCCGEDVQLVKILEIREYDYFDKMWEDLEEKKISNELLPGIKTLEEAVKIYEDIYIRKVGYTKNEIEEMKVIVVKFICIN